MESLVAGRDSLSRDRVSREAGDGGRLVIEMAIALLECDGDNSAVPYRFWHEGVRPGYARAPPFNPKPNRAGVCGGAIMRVGDNTDMQAVSENPLLGADLFRGGLFPRFNLVQPEYIVPGIKEVLRIAEERFVAIEASLKPSWEEVVEPLSELSEWVGRRWSLVSHLVAVKNSPELRAAHQEVQPLVVELMTRMAQSPRVFGALREIRHSTSWDSLPRYQQRVIETWLRDARKAGVELEGEARARFQDIVCRRAELATLFMNHLLDDTNEKGLWLSEASEVAGLPEVVLRRAVEEAKKRGRTDATLSAGPWFISVDGAMYRPFMEHCAVAARRAELYRLYLTRASSGERDNSTVIRELLQLAYEGARLLGYGSPAAMSLDGKMAQRVATVREFLEGVLAKAQPVARQQFAQLQRLAQEKGEQEEIKASDVSFWLERLREQEIGVSSEMLRPYFPLEQVLLGLFSLTERLFEVVVTLTAEPHETWHPDVRTYEVRNRSGELLGYFYLDPFSRPGEKRGGAWMDVCVTRKQRRDGELQLPIAYLVCNQTPPSRDESGQEIPSLMSFDEVLTLFHEFGHGLQHLLTIVDDPEVAGINNVEWDAVEIASQFMENWLYDRETLRSLARHYKTGEPLPGEWAERLLGSQLFMKALPLLSQIHYGLTDLTLYEEFDSTRGDPHAVFEELGKRILILPPLTDGRFLCGFSHIFAGGYSAGYYSYLWSEVLSADVFGAFREAASESDVAALGRKLRETILGLGGADDPQSIFLAFRGREPNLDAFLRDRGLVS